MNLTFLDCLKLLTHLRIFWSEQIRRMQAFGIELKKDDDSNYTAEVEVLLCGDKAFMSDEIGHAGASSSFPSYYRLVPRNHLRKKHLDGSPHNLSNPECHFVERTPEKVDRNYHQNLNDSRSGTLNTRGKYHHSIVGPRLLPLPYMLHFSISSLHIGLMVPLRLMGYIELDCDIIDGTKSKEDLAVIENVFEEMEGIAADELEEDAEVCLQESMESDETLTDAMRANKVRREELDVQWHAKSLEVMQFEEKQMSSTEVICQKMSVMMRFELLECGDLVGIDKIAKKVSRAWYSLKSFSKCDLCLLTGYDRDIEWRLCSTCQKRTHLFCQVYSDQDLALEYFQCRACTGVLGLDDIKNVLSETLASLKAAATKISVELARLRKEESNLKKESSKFMGVTRLKLRGVRHI